jgi:hypothetical protein
MPLPMSILCSLGLQHGRELVNKKKGIEGYLLLITNPAFKYLFTIYIFLSIS